VNSDKSENNWYALYTRSRAEKKAFEQLKSVDIESYLPLNKVLRQWSDRKKWVEVPLINSYIFVNLHPDHMRKVYQFPSIVAFVNDHGKPAIIPSHQIDAMRRTIESKLSFSIDQNVLQKGKLIKITSGPLLGVEGEIIEVKGQKKLIIEISHIGFKLTINIENADFELTS
jgi:transcriptional antiterminator RfaH